jgi:hypothetical protein
MVKELSIPFASSAKYLGVKANCMEATYRNDSNKGLQNFHYNIFPIQK